MDQRHVPAESVSAADLVLPLTIPGAASIVGAPRTTLQERLEQYGSDIFAEAARFEAAQRGDVSDVAQFTSTHVVDADKAVRRRSVSPDSGGSRASRVSKHIGLYLSAAGVGVGGNQLDKTWGIVIFVGSLVAGLFLVGLIETSKG